KTGSVLVAVRPQLPIELLGIDRSAGLGLKRVDRECALSHRREHRRAPVDLERRGMPACRRGIPFGEGILDAPVTALPDFYPKDRVVGPENDWAVEGHLADDGRTALCQLPLDR